MSNNKKKKAILNEATTRRFWKLAGLQPIHEKAYVFEEEEELEEANEEELEEANEEELEEMKYAAEDEEEPVDDLPVDDLGDEAPVDDMGEEPPVDDLGGDAQDVEVDVPEGDVASLRTARDILDQILSAVEGGEEEEGLEDDLGEELPEEEPALDDEEPLDLPPEELQEMVQVISTRVAARIQEALNKK